MILEVLARRRRRSGSDTHRLVKVERTRISMRNGRHRGWCAEGRVLMVGVV